MVKVIENQFPMILQVNHYSTPAEVTGLLNDMAVYVVRDKEKFIAANLEEIRTAYSWEHLVDEHEKYFEWLLAQKR